MGNDYKPARIGENRKLDRQTVLLLAVNVLFLTATALSATFLGVYIWKATNDFVVIGWFTLLTHLSAALTFWIAGNGVKEGNKMICLRIGIGVSALFYAIVLLLGKNAFHYIELLGVVQGIANGLFWIAFNVIYFELTNADNRDRFNGLIGVFGSLVGMVVPWCSGVLISSIGGEKGYRLIFLISFVIFIAGMGLSFLVRNRRTDGSYDWFLTPRVLRKPKTPWLPVFAALAGQGVRESVFGLMIGLLVYISTGSERRLGSFTLIVSAVAFIGFYAVGKWLKPVWRSKGMLIGTIVMTAVIVPFFTGVTYTTLLIFGIGASLFFPLFAIPMTSAVFDLIGSNEDSVRQRVEYVVMRELALNAGRIVGMVLFIATLSCSRAPLAIHILLLVTGSAPLLSWRFIRNLLIPQHKQG
ncbi:MFS transporter [Cohnella lupini]|uniref:YQGE family putative transporter n=1 Tax=Cohnella lupini TaxID=1294267 RepID=A0A3D9I8T0_9BACL|nr:MFS transporter [Cohnella lupini]RED58090.1 YQGE family putative transporter [Cohnella lupini]